jgi:LmbE family N-acetylglucosaminyl deacetylase
MMAEQEGPRKAMVIMAHPDDAEFLCAGSVARWCDEGWKVYYVIATSGDKGGRDESVSHQELAARREKEQRDAARVLGVRECIFLGYADGFLEESLELREQFVRLLRKYQPEVVVTWDGFRRGFNHRDHRIVGRVVYDAIYPAARSLLFYPEHGEEGLGPYRASELWLAGTEEPDHYVDITPYFDRKVEALRQHASQVGNRPGHEMVKRIRRWHRELGKRAGCKYAEAFRRVQFGLPPEPPRPAAKAGPPPAEARRKKGASAASA